MVYTVVVCVIMQEGGLPTTYHRVAVLRRVLVLYEAGVHVAIRVLGQRHRALHARRVRACCSPRQASTVVGLLAIHSDKYIFLETSLHSLNLLRHFLRGADQASASAHSHSARRIIS